MRQSRGRLPSRRFVIGVIVSMVGTALITAALAVYITPDVIRYVNLRRLHSNDEPTRRIGVAYLARHAADDTEVSAAAEAMLETDNDATFSAVAGGLQQAGLWGPQYGSHWLRQQKLMLGGEAPARLQVAMNLARLGLAVDPLGRDAGVADLLEQLLADEDRDVRYNGLIAVAANADQPRRPDLIASATQDAEPTVAAHAWIMLGLLKPGNMDLPWPVDRDELPDRLARAVAFAAHHIRGDPYPSPPTGPPEDADPPVKQLAELEALPMASADVAITDDMGDLIRLHAVRASRDATIDDLAPVFASDLPTLRDLACVTAVERFDVDQCRTLAEQLARSFDVNQQIGGAILAGLVGAEGDLLELLRRRAARRHDWQTAQMFRLGLAMMGQGDDTFDPAALLMRTDLQRTTVWLGLMHMGRIEALDDLFNPQGDEPVRLRWLFDQLRYWAIVKRYLPEAPDFWLWADVATQRFQVDVIRDWYLLHRSQMRFDAKRRVFTTEAIADL